MREVKQLKAVIFDMDGTLLNTLDDLMDIMDIRQRIEGLAARRAAENISEEELSDLREIVELQEF